MGSSNSASAEDDVSYDGRLRTSPESDKSGLRCEPLQAPQVALSFPLLVEDTTDADNQIALAGFVKGAFGDKLSSITQPKGVFGVSPRHVDLSFPLAFAKGIVKNRPDFRAFEPVKNAHEGTGEVPIADKAAGRIDSTDVDFDADITLRSEVRRTYASIMMTIGLDPNESESWLFMQRAFPCLCLNVAKEHLLSHHYFAREFLFDRGDMVGHKLGDPLSPKAYGKAIQEIDGDVASDASGAYDRELDVQSGLAKARRDRARKIIQASLDEWDKVLGMAHQKWIEDSGQISKNYIPYVTDVVIMAPCTLTRKGWTELKSCKRVWGMFFALDNAAEYGHWVMEEKAKNIFRNNFNTALDEDGTLAMLEFIRRKEVRAYFHPTELFKGEVGQKSWEVAREAVKTVKESVEAGEVDVPPLLAVYNSYNAAKSPNADPQQISDPMIVYEFLNYAANIHSKTQSKQEADEKNMMPVASYSPAIVEEDTDATVRNHKVALESAKSKGLAPEKMQQLRYERVFVVRPSYEPLNNGTYVGMNLVNRMVPEYSRWLRNLLLSKPPLNTPRGISEVLPIMDISMATMIDTPFCRPPGWFCGGT